MGFQGTVWSSGQREAHERLLSYAVIDTPRDAVFDRIVFTAAQLFRVPMALIALVDGDRLWIKAQVGFKYAQLPRSSAFCSEIIDDAVMVVEDASRDKRFAENPMVVGPPDIRFYAGTPLITPDGVRVGSLCVMDRAARTLMTRQTQQLAQLGESVVTLLEARRPTYPTLQ